MTTASVTPQAGIAVEQDKDIATGPILVATDGTPSSEAALKAAMQLAERKNYAVTALAVLEGTAPVAAEFGILVPLPADTDESRRRALLERVRSQVAQVSETSERWSVEVRAGDVPRIIAEAARELAARLIITGIGHHDLLSRVFGAETALQTLRATRKPLFAVSPNYLTLPKRVLIATDFSAASVRAARVAIETFDTISMLYLVHVAPRLEVQPEAFADWMELYGEGVGPAFARVKAELGLPAGVTVETITLQGKPSRALLEFGRSAGVDLIVSGSRGTGLFDRLLVGSTATGLIRGAHCSVFCVPAPRAVQNLPTGSRATAIPKERWAEEFAVFTKRNAGRRASLEVDDPEFGAQAQEHDYPFLGVAYDHNDERVEIMLGDFVGVRRHLTRGISGVTSVDRLTDENGRDRILRVSHGDGQTILTLDK